MVLLKCGGVRWLLPQKAGGRGAEGYCTAQELVRKGVSSEDIEHGLREVFGTEAHKLHVHTEDHADSDETADDSKREPNFRLSRLICEQPALAAAHGQSVVYLLTDCSIIRQ